MQAVDWIRLPRPVLLASPVPPHGPPVPSAPQIVPLCPQRRRAARQSPGRAKGGRGLRVTASAEDQKPLTFRRPLVTTLPFSEAVGTALLRMALRMVAADEPGWYAAYSAAAPVTWGEAMEVPP